MKSGIDAAAMVEKEILLRMRNAVRKVDKGGDLIFFPETLSFREVDNWGKSLLLVHLYTGLNRVKNNVIFDPPSTTFALNTRPCCEASL